VLPYRFASFVTGVFLEHRCTDMPLSISVAVHAVDAMNGSYHEYANEEHLLVLCYIPSIISNISAAYGTESTFSPGPIYASLMTPSSAPFLQWKETQIWENKLKTNYIVCTLHRTHQSSIASNDPPLNQPCYHIPNSYQS